MSNPPVPSLHPRVLAPLLASAVTLTTLAACDRSAPAAAPSRPAAAPSTASGASGTAAGARPAAAGNLSAEEVARAARGDLRCPAAAAAPRPAGTPVDDIVGVRPGLGWDEAARLIMCTHPLMVARPDLGNRFAIQTYGQPLRQGLNAGHAQPQVQRTGQQVMKDLSASAIARGNNQAQAGLAPGTARWYAGTLGMPGEERVAYIQREERFADDALPPVATVEKALLAKYGEPSRRTPLPDGLELQWAHDPAGRPQRGAAAGDCTMNPQVGSAVALRENCGVVVAARLRSLRDNPAIAQSISVGVVDQARGFALVTDTEARLQQAEAARRERQLQQANKSGKGPAL